MHSTFTNEPIWEVEGDTIKWLVPCEVCVPLGPVDEETGELVKLDIEIPPAAVRNRQTVIEG